MIYSFRNVDANNQIEQVKHCITGLFSKQTVDTFYLSMGGKLNELNVELAYPNKISISSNALYQMYPQYLRIHDPDKIGLIIAIDLFPSDESQRQTANALERVNRMYNQNMDIIVLDQCINASFINGLMQTIIPLLSEHGIENTKCIFANYIRFRNPNSTEFQFEEIVPRATQSALDTECGGVYSRCLYQWYGYTYYQYHYIYCYKQYHLLRMMHAGALLRLLKESLDTAQLTSDNRHLISFHVEQPNHQKKRQMWEGFCNNTLCLT
jgi:hypothetical protein